MSVSINSALTPYTYSYQNKVQVNLDKNDDAVWDKSELNNYADAYKKATGKTLDVDQLLKTYGNENGVIDHAAQQKMRADDALGLSELEKSTTSSGTSTTSTTSNTAPAAQPTMSQAQKDAIYSAVNQFTFDYSGKLQPLLDKNDDGLWGKDELTEYANAYNKATGQTLDVDALIKQYGNEDGFIDPKNQALMKKDDALGLSTLKAEFDSARASNSYYVANPISRDTTIDSKPFGGTSMQDLLEGMSSSGKMMFSTRIQSMESQQNMLNTFLSAGGNSFDSMFSLANARTDAINTYKLQMSQGGDSGTILQNMSGLAMNFTI